MRTALLIRKQFSFSSNYSLVNNSDCSRTRVVEFVSFLFGSFSIVRHLGETRILAAGYEQQTLDNREEQKRARGALGNDR